MPAKTTDIAADEELAPVRLGTLTPRMRGIVGDGGLAAPVACPEAVEASLFGFGVPGTPTGRATVDAADRRTCHSGSIHRHSVVFLSRECGSVFVGDAM